MKIFSYFMMIVIIVFGGYLCYHKIQINHHRQSRATYTVDMPIDRIVIEKAVRKMMLFSDDMMVREYEIDLGGNPVGHKTQEGDQKTPEGIYKISGRNPNSRYHLSLRISYPNDRDIATAHSRGVSPGGDIMIHGLPNKLSLMGIHKKPYKDWTLGCIAVQTNDEIEEIWDIVPNGTIVDIRP